MEDVLGDQEIQDDKKEEKNKMGQKAGKLTSKDWKNDPTKKSK